MLSKAIFSRLAIYSPRLFSKVSKIQKPTIVTSATRQFSEPAEKKQFAGESNKDDTLAVRNYSLHPTVVNRLADVFGITHFFPIQAKVFKPIQEGRDVVGKSKTGTGKTLAFLLPFIDKIVRDNYPRQAPRTAKVLILEPTRELANQVYREVTKLDPRLNAAVIYGGVSYDNQIRDLNQGNDFVIATPGRLKDLLNSGRIDLSETSCVILDEADEMLRFGFLNDLKDILSLAKPNRQNIFFSATYNRQITDLIERSTKNHVYIDCATEGNATPTLISHKAAALPSNEHLPTMIGALMNSFSAVGRVMIFVDKKNAASELESQLNIHAQNNNLVRRNQKYAAALHGDVSQAAREIALKKFREGTLTALVATDVAARGIDVPDVNLVIHLGIPDKNESYIHRSGRTGRAGKAGTSVLLYDIRDRHLVSQLSGATKVKFTQILSSDLEGNAMDDSVHHSLSKELTTAVEFLSAKNSKEVINGGKNTAYSLGKKIFDDLAKKGLNPADIAIAALEHSVKSQTSSVTASFSILSSTPNHTTVAFAQTNLNPSSIQKALSSVIDSPFVVGSIRSSQNATYADLPDEVVSLIKVGLQNGALSENDVAIPNKLPNEFFIEPLSPMSGRSFSERGGRGGYGNRGGRGGYENRGSFDNNRGGYENRSSFDNNRGGYENNRSFDNNRGGYNNRGYDNNRGGSNNGNRGGYRDRF